MKTKAILKYLPVVAAILGVLGYNTQDTEPVRTIIRAAAAADRNLDSFDWKAVGSLLSNTEKPGSSESQTRRSETSRKNRNTKPYSYSGRVAKIHDGDTLHVIDGDGVKHKIRMAYIDAPEINQAYGTRARDNLRAAADGRKVKVRVFETDRYNREVAQVSIGANDLNLMQIRDGAAWHYKSYAEKQQSKTAYTDYAAAQWQAKNRRTGLWHDKNPQAPWDFRREEREGQGGTAHGNRKDAGGQWFGIW